MPTWVERSKSKTGKHAYLRVAFVLDHAGRVVKEYKPSGGVPDVYSRGEGEEVNVEYGGEEIVAVLEMKKNFRGRVEGKVEVYDRGKLVYRAVYRKLKLRGSFGDPAYHFFVKKLFEYLKIPVKRENAHAHLRGRRRGD